MFPFEGKGKAPAAASAFGAYRNNNNSTIMEESLANLFHDDPTDQPLHIFADQSMNSSISVVTVSKGADRRRKQRNNRANASGSTTRMQDSSQSISCLFNDMAWNGSCASFVNTTGNVLDFSSSVSDRSDLALKLLSPKKKRASMKIKKGVYSNKQYNTRESKLRNLKQQLSNSTSMTLDLDSDSNLLQTNVNVNSVATSTSFKAFSEKEFMQQPVTTAKAIAEEKAPQHQPIQFVRRESCLYERGQNKLKTSSSMRETTVSSPASFTRMKTKGLADEANSKSSALLLSPTSTILKRERDKTPTRPRRCTSPTTTTK